MSIALQIIRELQVLVGKVNSLNPQAERKGGYFCLVQQLTAEAVPTLVVRVGEVNELHEHDHFERCQLVTKRLNNEAPRFQVSSCLPGMDGAVRADNDTVVGFSGYDAPWNELIMLALCVNMHWLKLSRALQLAWDDDHDKLKALLE
ncbi:MAG: hypothetical protein WCW31_03805 [Patescibacteria group bacterium]|jgi:hypothetical protein